MLIVTVLQGVDVRDVETAELKSAIPIDQCQRITVGRLITSAEMTHGSILAAIPCDTVNSEATFEINHAD
jgi:hypothetical protein